jgi:hypothetical protein
LVNPNCVILLIGSAVTTREIRCEACGALNRVPAYSVRRVPECGRCRCKLPETRWALLRRTIHRSRIQIAITSAVAIFAWVGVVMISGRGKQTESQQTTRAPASDATCVRNLVTSQGFNDGNDASERPAILTIRAAPGASYLVKLDKADSPALLFFVEAGQPLDARVPPGEFKLKYAVGNHWCNSDADLFGDDTVFGEADETLTVAPPDTGASHATIELPLQADGKLTAKKIDRDAFYSR